MIRKYKVKIIWSSKFAYAIGLLATDGNLSKDGRHILFTSKDKDLPPLFNKCLDIENKITKKARGGSKIKKYYVVQFSDRNFYEYLVKIGITPKKSKTIERVSVPRKYFRDFLRGCIDGDGSISIFNHPESKHKQLKVRLASASQNFLLWIHKNIRNTLKTKGGYIWKDNNKNVYTLSYAKEDGGKILLFVYYSSSVPCLKRKRDIAKKLGEW